MLVSGVHHVSINVSNSDAAAQFYTGVLGLKQLPRPDFGFPGHWLAMEDGRQLHLIEVENWVAPKGQHFAFSVSDLDATRQALQDNGVKVSEPSEIAGICRQSFFKDPCGNLIEINEPCAA